MAREELLFDCNYNKLQGQKTATLVAMFPDVTGEQLTAHLPLLVEYDCRRPDGSFYLINNKENYLLLFFVGEKGALFSTLRKATDENYWLYKNNVGETFDIKIKED